jgi:hypothetical protein
MGDEREPDCQASLVGDAVSLLKAVILCRLATSLAIQDENVGEG